VTAPTDHPATPFAGDQPTVEEIAALTAWMRRLSQTGLHRVDPGELAAFQLAKQDLLARIERHNHTPPTPCDTSQETRVD
jgi:hypothetical protein